MSRTDNRRWMIPMGAAAALSGVVGLGLGLVGSMTGWATAVPGATGTIVDLTVAAMPGGQPGIAGSYGVAGSPDRSADNDTVAADIADHHGILSHVTVDGAASTSWSAAASRLVARADVSGVSLRYNGIERFVDVGDMAAVASCDDMGASARVELSEAPTILGTVAPTGGVTTIDATGAVIGLPDADPVTLDVSSRVVQSVINDGTTHRAVAYLEVAVRTDRLADDLLTMRVGAVDAECPVPAQDVVIGDAPSVASNVVPADLAVSAPHRIVATVDRDATAESAVRDAEPTVGASSVAEPPRPAFGVITAIGVVALAAGATLLTLAVRRP